MNVFTYWEGPTNPFIDLCLETIGRHSPLVVLTPEKIVQDYGPEGQEAIDFAQGVPIPQRSDWSRFWVLSREGGVWVDADSIQVRPLDWLGQVPDADFIGIFNKHQNGNRGFLATPFGARKESPFMKLVLEDCRDKINRLKNGKRLHYGSTSLGSMSKVWRDQNRLNLGFNIIRKEHWRFNRIPWFRASLFLDTGTDEEHFNRPVWSKVVQLYHTTNVIPKLFRGRTREEILRDESFVGFLFRFALGMIHETNP